MLVEKTWVGEFFFNTHFETWKVLATILPIPHKISKFSLKKKKKEEENEAKSIQSVLTSLVNRAEMFLLSKLQSYISNTFTYGYYISKVKSLKLGFVNSSTNIPNS